MTEKHFSWFMVGLAMGACASALLAQRQRKSALQVMAGKIVNGKAFLYRTGARARGSASQLLDHGVTGLERASTAFTAAVEAGKSALAAR
jgi:hypothetical protein